MVTLDLLIQFSRKQSRPHERLRPSLDEGIGGTVYEKLRVLLSGKIGNTLDEEITKAFLDYCVWVIMHVPFPWIRH